jgi:CPA2 family monovalent cation:H+ antiporter-2
MILSPLPKLAGPRLLSWMGRLPPGKPRREGVQGAGPAGAVERVRDHAIILGYGPVGRWIARALRKLEMPYAVVELNPRTVREERRAGEAIVFGDASRPDILELVGVATAKLAVITIPDPAAARAATQLVRRLSPQIHVIVRVRFLREIQIFLDLGANEVVADEHQVRREVFARSLAAMGVTRTKIHELGGEVLA